MKNLFTLLALLYSIGVYAQPYAIGSTTITFTDPSRSNRTIETDIYYPAVTQGNNVSVANGQFPVIAFGHGFVMNVSAYQNIWTAVVPQGYIVALPKTEGGILPNHNNFGRDLAFVISALQQAGTNSSNLFFNKVAATSAVIGHSMGGGAAMLSVQYLPSITAVAGLAPAETNPSASTAAQQISLPALLFAGGNDCVTPAAQHSRLIYDNINSSCKWYLSIAGGSHCQFANANFNCSLGEATCSPAAAIARTVQQSIVNEYLLPWLNFELKNECSLWISKQAGLASDPRLIAVQDCGLSSFCPSPNGRKASNVKANSVEFTWNATECAASYEVRYRKTGTSTWIKKLTAMNSRIVYNLSPATSYEWQVRSVCDVAAPLYSSWGVIRSFSTASATAKIASIEDLSALYVYPNPSSGIIQLSGKNFTCNTSQISVFDAVGNSCLEASIAHSGKDWQYQIDLNSLPKGLYVLKVVSPTRVYTRRLLLQ